MTLADSHCHLDDTKFDGDRDDAIARAIDAGVTRMLSIGTGEGPPDLSAAIRLAERYEPLLATVGIHPQYAPQTRPEHYKALAGLLRHPKCVAVGEIGLDYYWKPYDSALQAEVFREQMAIAAEAGKPIIIHTRDAWADTMSLLRQHWLPTGLPCIMHCFTGGPPEAQEALELGFYVSFAGVVTYPKATDVQAAAKMVPLDRLLVETDSPYLAPVPNRGKRNEPSFVAHTAGYLAALRGVDPEVLASATTTNFLRVVTRSGPDQPISYTEGFE